jgi:hypothetical protein
MSKIKVEAEVLAPAEPTPVTPEPNIESTPEVSPMPAAKVAGESHTAPVAPAKSTDSNEFKVTIRRPKLKG